MPIPLVWRRRCRTASWAAEELRGAPVDATGVATSCVIGHLLARGSAESASSDSSPRRLLAMKEVPSAPRAPDGLPQDRAARLRGVRHGGQVDLVVAPVGLESLPRHQ